MNLRTAAMGIPAYTYILSGPPTIQQVKHLKDSVLPAPTTQTHNHTRSLHSHPFPERTNRKRGSSPILLPFLAVESRQCPYVRSPRCVSEPFEMSWRLLVVSCRAPRSR
jgi:hypothetical protein